MRSKKTQEGDFLLPVKIIKKIKNTEKENIYGGKT
jgi:hypothetical protein